MALRIGDSLPSFAGASEWINGVVADDAFPGAPVVVQFWSVSCFLCLANMPEVEELKKEFAASDVRFVAVHLPHDEEDKQVSVVEHSMNSCGLSGSCALDNDGVIAARFQTGHACPHYLLFDQESKMRMRAVGGRGLNLVRSSLQRLHQVSL